MKIKIEAIKAFLQEKKIVVLVLLALFVSYAPPLLIKLKYPNFGYSSDLIASSALFLSIYVTFIKKNPSPKIDYSIDPKEIVGSIYHDFRLKIVITNSGERDIVITPAWLDIRNQRLEVSKIFDEHGNKIEKSVQVSQSVHKVIHVDFDSQNSTYANKLQNQLIDACNKKDIRIAEGIKETNGRLVWYDGSKRSQEMIIPIGHLFFTQLRNEMS